MAQRPTTIPNWTQGLSTQISAPTPSQQASGWTAGQRPSYQVINWLQYQNAAWLAYLNDAVAGTAMSAAIDPLIRLIGGGLWSYSAQTNILSWSSPISIAVPELPDSDNQISAGSIALVAGQCAYVQANIPFQATGATTSGTAQVTGLSYTSGISAGQSVTGSGVPSGTTVLTLSGSTLTLSQPATQSASGVTLTFVGSGALSVQAADVASLSPSANTVLFARSTGSLVYVGVNAGQFAVRDNEVRYLSAPGFVSVAQALAGQALTARQVAYMSQGSGDATVTQGTAASGSTTLTLASGSGLGAGQAVAASGIPAGTTITAISGNTATLSQATTTALSGASITCTRVAGQIYLADSSLQNGSVRGGALGLVQSTVAAGSTANIVMAGRFDGFSSLVAGSLYYLDPQTVGGITAVRPTTSGSVVAPVALATSATSLALNAAGQAANTEVVSVNAWPQYGAATEAQLAQELSQVGQSGGVIVITASFSISQIYTVPSNVVLQGRKSAATITALAGGQLSLAGNASEIRDVSFTTAAAGNACVSISGNANIVRGCSFTLGTTNCTGVVVTGNSNRLYQNSLYGTSQSATAVGINYVAGADNMDESTVVFS